MEKLQEIITWEDIGCLIKIILTQINNESFKPDLIIGLARGGLIPAGILSYKFSCKVETIRWSYMDIVHQDTTSLTNLFCTPDQNILIVDDLCDSGKTIEAVTEYVANICTNKNIKVATLINNIGLPSNMVNFTGRNINREYDKQWFVFPWE